MNCSLSFYEITGSGKRCAYFFFFSLDTSELIKIYLWLQKLLFFNMLKKIILMFIRTFEFL